MICHLDWLQSTTGIILMPQNYLDKLWFTFSDEIIIKFQYIFFKFTKKYKFNFKDRYVLVFGKMPFYHKTCHIYPAYLSKISWKFKTGNIVISYHLWVKVSFSKVNYLVEMNQ